MRHAVETITQMRGALRTTDDFVAAAEVDCAFRRAIAAARISLSSVGGGRRLTFEVANSVAGTAWWRRLRSGSAVERSSGSRMKLTVHACGSDFSGGCFRQVAGQLPACRRRITDGSVIRRLMDRRCDFYGEVPRQCIKHAE